MLTFKQRQLSPSPIFKASASEVHQVEVVLEVVGLIKADIGYIVSKIVNKVLGEVDHPNSGLS